MNEIYSKVAEPEGNTIAHADWLYAKGVFRADVAERVNGNETQRSFN